MATNGPSGLPQVARREAGADGGSAPAATTRPVFGSREGLAKLVVKNTLLTVVTLGIYRFWARTALRRFYWSNVAVAGERFEYTGTGAELFVGFLFAMMVLAPVLGAFTVVQLLLDPESIWAGVLAIVYFAGIYLLIATAIFRARRYRLSRTRWRGIRFAQDGSTWRFIALTLGWTGAVALTLGVAFPWLRWAQQRYMMRSTLLGDRRFGFEGGPRALIWRWLLVIACFVVPMLAGGAMLIGAAFEASTVGAGDAGTQEATVRPELAGWLALSAVLMPFGLIAGGIAFLNYRIAEFRAFAAATRLGEVTVRSGARVGPVVGAAALGLLAFLGLFLAATPLVLAVPIAGIPVMIAAVLLGVPLIIELIVRFRILRHVITTLELANAEALDEIAQSAAAAPRVGEGLADAFDIGTM